MKIFWLFVIVAVFVYSINCVIARRILEPKYHVLPIKNGYISLVGPILWGLFGVHLYFQNMALDKFYRKMKMWQKALATGVDAMIVETLINFLAIGILGDFFFYYFPPDLWHFTSFINLPLWAIGGLVIYRSMNRFLKAPSFAIKFSIVLVLGLLV
jgi:hypothetical protein